jgi:hypothetical protein
MAEMQEFSPDAPKNLSQAQRKQFALVALAVAALVVSFWSGMQFQKDHTISNSSSVQTASKNDYYPFSGNDSTNSYPTPNNTSLDVQTN